ncbi:MAG: protein tyrosine phosphatase [Pseudomonadota bacterium]
MSTVLVCPLHHLAETLQTSGATDLVTFASPGNSPTDLPAGLRHLALEFNDIAAPRDGYLEPQKEHIDALLDFVRAWDGNRPLVLNCWMGISRSTAAAALTLAALERQPDCINIAQRLRLASPCATPNPLMIALGDQALHLGGALSQAISSIGRGAEAFTGTPFELTADIAKRGQNA